MYTRPTTRTVTPCPPSTPQQHTHCDVHAHARTHAYTGAVQSNGALQLSRFAVIRSTAAGAAAVGFTRRAGALDLQAQDSNLFTAVYNSVGRCV